MPDILESMSSGYYLTSNGTLQRFVRLLNAYLKTLQLCQQSGSH